MILLYVLSGVGAVAIIFAIWFGIDNAIEEKIYNNTNVKIEEMQGKIKGLQEHVEKIDQDLIYLMVSRKEE